MRAFRTMVYRQLKRFFRAKSRVVGSVSNSLVWLLFFGLGFSGMVRGYMEILAPGVFAMTIFNHSLMSGISVIWDREFGFLKEVLVAPASRKESIAGRIFGDSIVAIIQGVLILLFSFALVRMDPLGVIPSIVLGFMLAVAFSSLGVYVAMKMRSMEGFQMIISLLMLPIIFLSGALFPLEAMPGWMRCVAYANPMTYAVDGARFYLTHRSYVPPTIDWIALFVFSVVILFIATISFERETIE